MATGICGIRACCFRLQKHKPLLASFASRRRFSTNTTCSVTLTNEKKIEKEKVLVISGPTGAGKSRLALELAKRLNGEIISADSVQDARQATKDILDRGHVPIVTGGTGLYLRWFVYGKPDVPKACPEIASEAHSDLENLQRDGDWDAAVQLVVNAGDPKAKMLAANDWYRLRRSLEIIKSSGSPPSAFRVPYDSFRGKSDLSSKGGFEEINSSSDVSEQIAPNNLEYYFICFFLSGPRIDLYRSIDLRCEDMISGRDGLLSEARYLLEMGLLPNSNSATRAIGYRQAMEYLLRCRQHRGCSSTREFYAFLSEFQKGSRNFAKRQMTWFRNEHIYHWLDASKPLEKVLNFIYDAYHDQTGPLVVPDSLKMKKDVTNHREVSELKGYRTRNRQFVSREDCSDVLDWIMKTQGSADELVHAI